MKFEGYSDAVLRQQLSGDRFTVTYRFSEPREAEALAKLKNLTVEQTVEFPADHIECEAIQRDIIGRIESFSPCEGGYRGVVSYAEEIATEEFPQFLNVVFGNSSLLPGITVERIDPTERMLQWYGGAKLGVPGLRQRLGVYDRPLSFTALKPMGLPSDVLAHEAYCCTLGGMDLIKDDHGLSNQSFSLYRERVEAVCQAVRRGNEESGGHTIYVPNVSGTFANIMDRVRFAEDCGAGGVMVAPGLMGFDTMAYVVRNTTLPVVFHPAFIGCYVDQGSGGFDCGCILGQLPRLAGADIAVFPNYGGRFSLSTAQCGQIVAMCREKMGELPAIFPAPAGGMRMEKVEEMRSFYGEDVALLMGGGLFTLSADLTENCRSFAKALEESGREKGGLRT